MKIISSLLFRWHGLPRIAKQMGAGFAFMILSIVLSRHDPNVIWFIFAAMFALCGLVLFVMGMINGFVDVFSHFLHKKPKDAIK